MADEKYNRRNPAVQRILQEVKELQASPSDDFMSLPLEPNGRFETQTKICLSISNYHPEHWQTSWSVRTALVALIAFMPTSPDGASASLGYPAEERRVLAIKSRKAPPKYGSLERQKLIDEIHEYMLSTAPRVPKANPVEAPEAHGSESDIQSLEKSQDVSEGGRASEVALASEIVEEEEPRVVPAVQNAGAPAVVTMEAPGRIRGQQRPVTVVQRPADDRLFTWAAVGLTIAIVFLLLKKFIKSSGYGAVLMDES